MGFLDALTRVVILIGVLKERTAVQIHMERTFDKSLMEYLKSEMGCNSVEELTKLTQEQKRKLAEVIREIPSESVLRSEWVDALEFMLFAVKSQDCTREVRRHIAILLGR